MRSRGGTWVRCRPLKSISGPFALWKPSWCIAFACSSMVRTCASELRVAQMLACTLMVSSSVCTPAHRQDMHFGAWSDVAKDPHVYSRRHHFSSPSSLFLFHCFLFHGRGMGGRGGWRGFTPQRCAFSTWSQVCPTEFPFGGDLHRIAFALNRMLPTDVRSRSCTFVVLGSVSCVLPISLVPLFFSSRIFLILRSRLG